MINKAKQAIFQAIIECCDKQLGHDAKHFADAYSALMEAEAQEKMTQFAIMHCPEHDEHLDDNDFPTEIG